MNSTLSKWVRTLVPLALLASMGVNAYLLMGVEPSSHSAKAEPPEPQQVTATSVGDASRLTALPNLKPLSSLHCSDLEARLAKAEATIESLRPLFEQFEHRSDRSVENETRVHVLLDRMFKTQSASARKYDIECRGDICKLTILDAKVANESEWMTALQSDPEAIGMFNQKMFGESASYLQLEESAITAGNRLAVTIVSLFSDSAEVAACKSANKTSGTLTLSLAFDSRSRNVVVNTGGSLEYSPLGVCLRRALERIVETVPVPPLVTSIPDMPIAIELP